MNSSLTTSPHACVQSIALNEVRWTHGFWAERFELCRYGIVPHLWELMKGTSPTHYLQNFRIAAGLEEGRHRGAPFNDGDFYKWLEAACAVLDVAPDPEWEARIEEAIALIAQAQRADGYLHTKVLIAERNGTPDLKPWPEPTDFEMYNMGHLFTAACVHHRVTGRTSLLEVARKTADFLDKTFQHPTPQMMRCAVCPSHYMGLVELYRTTGETRYLELAERLIELRNLIPDGTDDNQDRIPFKQQRVAAGHAVRANYLYAGATDVFLETGDGTLWEPLESIWADVVKHKLYITGGCGALYDGASPDGVKEEQTITRVHQAYGRNYQLPNQAAYNETCANIGSVLWNWRMFRATDEARFMDVLELTLFNSVLCGATLDGTLFSYTNPLRALEKKPALLRYGGGVRAPFVSSFCCPPNLARTLAQMHSYAYAKSEETIWVNLYGSSTLQTEVAGEVVNLTQETDYPWGGSIKLKMNECGDAPFVLKLRIPGWAQDASVRLNDAQIDETPASGSYFQIRRTWKPGDVIELNLPMSPQLIEAHPLVEEVLNQVAVQRGPLVYCIESPDLPQDVRISDVCLSTSIRFTPRFDTELLGGVVVLEGEATARTRSQWNSGLYRAFTPSPTRPFRARFIPYFVWGNRGEPEMTVWLPLVEAPSEATVRAS
jgi:DUF1680 family protein